MAYGQNAAKFEFKATVLQQNSGSNHPRTSKTARTKPNDQQLEQVITITVH